jgi:hypothetical protein
MPTAVTRVNLLNSDGGAFPAACSNPGPKVLPPRES